MSNGNGSTISFVIAYCLIAFATEAITSQANLINFGGSTDEAKQAADYLMADSEFSKTQPTDELKRTQRSFWKKLFKHGWFGEEDCNTSNYDGANGNNYNTQSNDQPFPVFQPFRNIQQWRPFQPLFRGNCQRCGYQQSNYNYVNDQGTPSYNNNPSSPPTYQDSGDGGGSTYVPNEEQEQDNTPYNAPAVPSTSSDDTVANNLVTESTYETPSDAPTKTNTNNAYAQTPYAKGESSLPPYENTKIPQILYQPIIYVSPQLKDCALIKPNSKNEYSGKQTVTNDIGYETLVSDLNVASKQTQKYDKAPEINYADGQTYSPHGATPCIGGSATVAQHDQPYSMHSPPTVSTVSTIYTVITPSQNPTDTTNTGPSKYSLFPPSSFSSPSYGDNKLHSLPTPVAPATSTQTCVPPLVLTLDDQPYRVCPELFDEYNRCLNKIVPCTHGNPPNTGNTFINAQLINY